MFAHINGIRMAYSDRGQRHPMALLLVHGFPLDHRLWAAQTAALASDMRVIAPDLCGFGQTESRPGPLSMETHADDLAALLDHLKIRTAVVAGLSMGGYIAFAFWRRHPARVRALILADTRAEPDSGVARAGRDAAIAAVQQSGAAAYAEEMLPRLLSPTSLANPAVVAAARKMMTAQPAAGIVAALASLRDRPDSRPTLPTVTVPALVVGGRGRRPHPARRCPKDGRGDSGRATRRGPRRGASQPAGKPEDIQRRGAGFPYCSSAKLITNRLASS